MTAGNATSLAALRQCQAVLLPALFGATLAQTASALGVSRATVPRLQRAFRKRQSSAPARPRNWGGRRQFLRTEEEEAAFLKPWLKSAAAGNLAVVSPIRAALAQRLGQAVKPSVVYRLLARHGWRRFDRLKALSPLQAVSLPNGPKDKVAPDTRHPKSQPAMQEAWKKTPRSVGNPAEPRGSPGPARPLDVPGRGPFWAHGEDSALLVTRPTAPGGGQRLRTRVSGCLWRGPSAGGGVGLDDLPGHEHRKHGRLSGASQCGPPARLHRHDRRWGKLPCRQSAGRAREHPPAPAAGLLARTQPAVRTF